MACETAGQSCYQLLADMSACLGLGQADALHRSALQRIPQFTGYPRRGNRR